MPGLLGGLASLGGKKSRKLKELQPTLAEVMNADEDGNTPMCALPALRNCLAPGKRYAIA